MIPKARGRPKRFAEYEALLAELPKGMEKRPRYLNAIGVFRGAKVITAWIKVRLPHGGIYRGRSYPAGAAIEVKLGNLSSWTWEALEAKRDELQGKADRNEPLEADAPKLFSEYAKEWLERLKRRTRGYRTAEIHLNAHLANALGMKALGDIRMEDINAYIADRLAIVKPSTVDRELNTLNSILNDAVRNGRLERNPCLHMDPIKGIQGRQRFLDATEVKRLLEEAERVGQWFSDFILWMLHSGMRKGEVLSLEWRDVRHLPNGRSIVLVERSKADRGRIVTCTDTMAQILQRQQARLEERKNKAKGEKKGRAVSSHVFPIAKMTLRRKWELVREKAGLSDVTIHDLRRTHSTQAVVAGVDLRTLAGRLGHSNLSMLERHYAAIVGRAAEDAAIKIERAFG